MLDVRIVLVVALASLFALPVQAGVREDQRSCQFGYWKSLQRGAAPPQTRDAQQQYCTALAYWFQPSPLPRDPARAAAWYEAAAKQGHTGAMIGLGYQYERGHGVPQNPARAVELYRRAAERGSSDGMFLLARAYASGSGVGRKDPALAHQWLQRAAKAGNLEAQASLAQSASGARQQGGWDEAKAAFAAWGRGDFATSSRLYRRAADLGNTNAMVALGTHYRLGQGVPLDLRAATSWYGKAARLGDPAGQAQFGLAHENGEGVAENWAEMRRWCERSAAQVHPLGLSCVGRLYQFGMAVPMNRDVARQWLERAADRDNPWARFWAVQLRSRQNCIGYRSPPERERFLGVCVEPTGLNFPGSRERNRWLQARYNEVMAEAMNNWAASGDGYPATACRGYGGSWSGGNCYVMHHGFIDPYTGR